ncbi:flagellar brake protein|uniref:flagellar brake protein n=1 Tax=Noviherbaspirillum sp. L7-7A TaxID=2850560 RepID=UPI001C2CB3F8|nr:flagellar brake protein [Noviherbaspirillum sp. L7-7A]MBV0879212.1 flagellar brake protein [Noviherbaspirillum sp. L7-7A]
MDEILTFDSLHLHAGTRLQILIVRDVKPIAYFSTLIGFVRDEYLIVKIPQLGKNMVSMREGDRLMVRVFSGLSVGVFNVTVMRVFLHPVYYLHVSFPDLIQGSRLRSAMRVKVDVPCKVVCANDPPVELQARLADVSMVGALVESAAEIGAEGDEVQLSFTINNRFSETEIPIETRVIVRSAQARSADENGPIVHTYGLEFKGLSQTDELMLQNFTYEIIMSDRRNII